MSNSRKKDTDLNPLEGGLNEGLPPPHGDEETPKVPELQASEPVVDFSTATANLTLFERGVVGHKLGTYGLRPLNEWLNALK